MKVLIAALISLFFIICSTISYAESNIMQCPVDELKLVNKKLSENGLAPVYIEPSGEVVKCATGSLFTTEWVSANLPPNKKAKPHGNNWYLNAIKNVWVCKPGTTKVSDCQFSIE